MTNGGSNHRRALIAKVSIGLPKRFQWPMNSHSVDLDLYNFLQRTPFIVGEKEVMSKMDIGKKWANMKGYN
jgi:hypothetical protein